VRLGFPSFTHRALRRMFITRAIERGVDVKVIAEWQGHRDGGRLILQTYSHVRPEHSNRMAALMTTGAAGERDSDGDANRAVVSRASEAKQEARWRAS